MPCAKPLLAWQCHNGDVIFVERNKHDIRRELQLPCGQCVQCRIQRSREWAMRCMHEASLHKENAFVTLTYNDENMPDRGMLDYPEFQRFMKRLRKRLGPVRFYMCGEYGELNWRPHYHACLFGRDFADKVFFKATSEQGAIYTSAVLSELWPHGFASTGDVTFQSAGYVARYCLQKVNGDAARFHYAREDSRGVYSLPPEFNRMSLKPGIGAEFLRKWETDIYPHDYVVIAGGKKVKPPKYYDKVYARKNEEEYEEIAFRREKQGRSAYKDNTPERLAVKAEVAEARLKFYKREI